MERRLGPLLGRTSYDPDVQFSWRGRDFLEGWVDADRNKRPIGYVETRNIDPRTFYSLRLRKTF